MSHSAGQSFLMFTELPSELTVFDTNYLFEYSESYNGTVMGNCSIEGYQYCVPFNRAFELLLAENYSAFILTIDSNAVCIYCTNDGKYKIFDSHSKDIYGRSHPQGTCVLLEAASISNVVLHFQSLYSGNNQFELKAVNILEIEDTNEPYLINNISNIENTELSGNVLNDNKSTDFTCLCEQCCAISLYSICYSIIKPSNYWDVNTITAVCHFGTILYCNIGVNSSSNLPDKVEICGYMVHVKLQANYQGVVDDQAESQLKIESLICHGNENTSFLIWLGDYCISCIFTLKQQSYSILAFEEYDVDDRSPRADFIKNIDDKHTLIKTIFKLAHSKIKGKIVCYESFCLFVFVVFLSID